MMRIFSPLLLLVFSCGLCAADIPLVQRVALVDGTRVAGRFAGFLADGKLEFQIAGEQRAIAANDLVQFGVRRELARGPGVLLSDGSLLAAGEVRLTAAGAVVASNLFGTAADANSSAELKLPLDRVRAVVFQLPASAKERDALFDQLLAARGDEDRLLLENGDVVAGTLHLPEEPADGPPGKEKAAGETFTVEIRVGNRTQRVEVPKKRVAALRFSPALVNVPETPRETLEIGLRDGTFLRSTSISPVPADGSAQVIELAGGLKLPVNVFLDLAPETTYLRSRQERVMYLTDLAPVAFRHWPFLTTEWPLARGRNVLGGRMRAGGFLEEQGLGMHSRSRAIYAVPPGAKRFEAEAALDDAAGGRGSVVFRVLKLTGQSWTVAAESAAVRGGDPPTPLSVDVTGAEQIALVVEFGERGDECDWANWLGARFVK